MLSCKVSSGEESPQRGELSRHGEDSQQWESRPGVRELSQVSRAGHK